MTLREEVRDIVRLRRILGEFANLGFAYYIHKSHLRRYLPLFHRIKTPAAVVESDDSLQAIRIREAFERLGPTFVKLGQLLSLRPDLIPERYCQEFAKLQDHVQPVPFSEIKAVIEEDLGKPLLKLFKKFESIPIASASIAQVYGAILHDGTRVAVKVQRPGIKETIDADLDILFAVAQAVEDHIDGARNFRPVEVVKEFALWTRRELNFEIEAHNAVRLREAMKEKKGVYVPFIYTQFSSRHVLTMEFVPGVKMDDLRSLARYKINIPQMVMIYFTSILEQALGHGFFHADPHPANIFVRKDGTLVYLDFGIMGELSEDDRHKVIRFISSLQEKDENKCFEIIVSLARNTEHADLGSFKEEALPLFREVYTHSIGERSAGKVLYTVIALGARKGILFDPNHILMAKAVYQAEGLAVRLDPHFKIAEGLEKFIQEYAKKNYSPLQLARRLRKTALIHRDLLLDLPDHIVKIMERMEQVQRPDNHIQEFEEMEKRMERVMMRRSIGMIIAALIIGASVLLYSNGKQAIGSVPISYIMIGTTIPLLYFYLRRRR